MNRKFYNFVEVVEALFDLMFMVMMAVLTFAAFVLAWRLLV